MLTLEKKGEKVTDPTKSMFRSVRLPPLQIGYMMLFNVADKLSYGLILQATHGVEYGDLARTPRF